MVKIVFGGGSLSEKAYFNTAESGAKVFDILLANNITTLDTARLYTGSEVFIGAQPKRTSFNIDTKLEGGFGTPGHLTHENTLADARDSLKRVDIKQFDVLYIHAPDTTVPFEEALAGVNDAYKEGIFRRFGLSNFTAEQVQQVYDIAKAKGYVLPTVFQGNYSPVARHLESLLFPTLKKLGIKFYAYSPLAGGFLTKTAADLDSGAGRFNAQALGGLYNGLYNNDGMRNALTKWNQIAEEEGVTKAELAYRWVAFHSAIADDEENGVIFGASKHDQLEQTTKYFTHGKLSTKAAEGIESVWDTVKDSAPVDNFHKFTK